jgi:hypothetical protein
LLVAGAVLDSKAGEGRIAELPNHNPIALLSSSPAQIKLVVD